MRRVRSVSAGLLGLVVMALPARQAGAQDIWSTPEQAKQEQGQAEPRPEGAAEPSVGTSPENGADTSLATETQPGTSAATESEPPPAQPAAVPETYDGFVLLGLRQVVLRDFDSALLTLRRAAELAPGSPVAFCHLGDAQLARGELDEARAAFDSCARFATLANVSRFVSLALVGLARAAELGQGTVRDKREAWLRVRDGVTEPGAKALAEARLSMYDAALQRDTAYTPVRERSAERAARNKPSQ